MAPRGLDELIYYYPPLHIAVCRLCGSKCGPPVQHSGSGAWKAPLHFSKHTDSDHRLSQPEIDTLVAHHERHSHAWAANNPVQLQNDPYPPASFLPVNELGLKCNLCRKVYVGSKSKFDRHLDSKVNTLCSSDNDECHPITAPFYQTIGSGCPGAFSFEVNPQAHRSVDMTTKKATSAGAESNARAHGSVARSTTSTPRAQRYETRSAANPRVGSLEPEVNKLTNMLPNPLSADSQAGETDNPRKRKAGSALAPTTVRDILDEQKALDDTIKNAQKVFTKIKSHVKRKKTENKVKMQELMGNVSIDELKKILAPVNESEAEDDAEE